LSFFRFIFSDGFLYQVQVACAAYVLMQNVNTLPLLFVLSLME